MTLVRNYDMICFLVCQFVAVIDVFLTWEEIEMSVAQSFTYVDLSVKTCLNLV